MPVNMHARTAHGEELERETTLVEGQPDRHELAAETTNDAESSDGSSSSDGEEEEEGEGEDRSNSADPPRGPAGYAHLAEFMIKTEHSMVRRYRELSLMNLLYLQAEIHHLKTKLDTETAADAKDKRSYERRYWDFHWATLATSGNRGNGRRWEIWLKLRERLYEYCACMSFIISPIFHPFLRYPVLVVC